MAKRKEPAADEMPVVAGPVMPLQAIEPLPVVSAAPEPHKAEPQKAEPPRIEPAKVEPVRIETPKIELPTVEAPSIDPAAVASEPRVIAFDPIRKPAAEPAPAEGWQTLARRHGMLAASLACAAVLGAVAGAFAVGLTRPEPPPPVTVTASNTQALEASVAKLTKEVATLKAGVDAANKTASTQFGRLADRLDRTEKAQIEPASRLAKLTESIDRLEQRSAAAAAAPAYAAADITNSVTTVAKQQSKPAVIEGWRLRDFYDGRAVLESRSGELYEVGPGSTLPGLGKVETIKREDGRVVVVTPKGVITTAMEQRRPPYYLPYRY